MNKRAWIGVGIVVAAAVVALLIMQPWAPSSRTLKIGAVLPLTGPAGQYGKYCQQGMLLAFEEVNRQTSTLGLRVEIIFEDSKADPKEAVAAANKLISVNKVPVLLCLTTSDTSALAPICERARVVLLTGTVAPGAADKGRFVFRNAADLAADAEAMADLCINKLGFKRIAMIGLHIDAHLAVERVFRRKVESLGGALVSVQYGNQGDTDFRTQLTLIKSADPEALYVLGYVEIAYILKQAREIGLQVQFLGDPSMESLKVVEIAGEAAEGVIYTRAAFDPNVSDQRVSAFRAAYKKRFDEEPEVFAAQSYDSIRILAHVITERGFSSEAISEGLLQVKDFPGVSGDTTFLPNGDVRKPVAFRMIKGGKFVPCEEAQ